MRPDDQQDAAGPEAEARAEWRRVAAAVRAGQAGLDEIAAALQPLDHVAAFVPPGEFARFMQDLDSAVQEKGVGNVNVRDAATPRVHGVETDDGFMPALFTDDDQAREFAVTNGLIEPADAAPFTFKHAEAWMWDVMAEGHVGAVIDQGTDHEVRIERSGCARLFALLNLEAFAKRPTLWLVHAEGRLALIGDREHGTMRATVYSEERAANWAAENLQFPACTVPPMATTEMLHKVLRAGCTHLTVDAGFPTQFVYERDDLVKMLELLGEQAPDAQVSEPDPGDPHAAMDSGESSAEPAAPSGNEDTAVDIATRWASFDAVEPPGRPDAKSFERFRDVARMAAQPGENGQIWDLVDAVAFDLDLYVPRHGARVDGLFWPSFFRHPEQEGQAVAYAFSRQAVANTRNDAAEMGDAVMHLSGIEALRWAWAAPSPIHEVVVDSFPGTVGSLSFPTSWVLSAVWPHFYDIAELDKVPAVPPARLGRHAAARGTQPEVIRAMVRGWQSLVFAGTADESGAVEFEGGRYLPVFSSADAFFAFDQANAGILKPAPKPETAPFGDWLNACRDVDGVVLDPGGRWPITFDATELLVLHRWATEGRRPHGTDFSIEVAQRLHDGSMSERMAGQVLADWPRYFMCIQRQPDGNVLVLTLPDRDCGAIFSSQKRAELYLEVYRQAGVIDGSWEPTPVLARWQHSVFHSLAEHYEEGGWIDPCPPDAGLLVWANNFLGEHEFDLDPTLVMDGHPGVHVHGDVLAAALQRLDQKLKPRVPEFVPADRRSAA